MSSFRAIITMLGIYIIVLLSTLCTGQVKIDEDQTYINGGYARLVNYACENSVLHVECQEGHVIQLQRGNYGRASAATCYHDFTAGWYCRSNSSEQIMRERCHRKRSCRIEASNEILGDSCPTTTKYLDMQYYCVKDEIEAAGTPIKETHPKESERQIIYACESTPLHAQCEEGKVINVQKARYGKSNSPTCHKEEWFCNANSTESIVRERCHQKRSCKVDVSNEVFGDPCPYNLKYLEMQYSCVSDPASSSSTTKSIEITSPTNLRVPTTVSEAPIIPTKTNTGGCDDYDLECLKFQCPEGSGNFAHPTNENMFIFCMNWRPRADACDEGLVYLERFTTCFSKHSLFFHWLKSQDK